MLIEVLMSYEEIKHPDGSFRREWRDENGKFHRELEPSVIHYNPDASISTECFHLNGVQHRELGPAVIGYRLDGSIEWEDFYLNGEFIGKGKKGFWALWDRLTEDKRQKPELLRCLSRFS
jgi:hypothetical protein